MDHTDDGAVTRRADGTPTSPRSPAPDGAGAATEQHDLLDAVRNLSRFHHDHERFYASSPRETAVEIQRHARALQGLADRWSWVAPEHHVPWSPYQGCEDLNEASATQLDGILFMEGEGRPVEIGGLIAWLRSSAATFQASGAWLTQAMEASWAMAEVLIEIDRLSGVIGERHRIIANDLQAASMSVLVGRNLERAADMLDRLDLSPAAVREDLAGERNLSRRLFAAAELLDHAADLACESAGLVHDNERRWRVFRHEVVEMIGSDR
jgi:hypothetical protein